MNPKLAKFLAEVPDLDENGTFTGPEPAAMEKVFEAILAGGPSQVVGLIDMLVPVDDGKDYRVRYLLHGLATHLCRTRSKQRAMFTKTLASQIGGDRPKPIQGFLIRQLQVVGGSEVAEVLGAALLDEALGADAANALIAIGHVAVEQLRRALPKARGKSRLNVVQALGVLKDRPSAGALKQAAGDADREVRLAAVWGLANICDPGAVGVLIKAAGAEAGHERIGATKACLLLAENLAAAGRKPDAKRLYTHLRDTRKGDDEQYVREAAERGLAAVIG